MLKHFKVAGVLSLALILSSCGGTCNDYADSWWGRPAGCECLDNVLFGCSAFDTPQGWGFASYRAGTARNSSPASASVNVTLNQKSSSCPNLQRTVQATATARVSGSNATISVPGLGAVRLSNTRSGRRLGRWSGRITRAIPSAPGCIATATVDATIAVFSSSSADRRTVAVRGAVRCFAGLYQCQFNYQGRVTGLK